MSSRKTYAFFGSLGRDRLSVRSFLMSALKRQVDTGGRENLPWRDGISVGERDGPVTFHVHPDPQGSTTVDWQEGDFATPTTVPMRTIDSLIQEREIPQPDLIKMDIQAGELAAIKGAVTTLPMFALSTWKRGSNRPMAVRSSCSST